MYILHWRRLPTGRKSSLYPRARTYSLSRATNFFGATSGIRAIFPHTTQEVWHL